MHLHRCLLLAASFVSLAFAGEEPFEALPDIPEGWERIGPANPNQELQFRIALVQPRVDKMYTNLQRISDPYDPKYGRYLTQEEIDDFMQPSSTAAKRVMTWLEKSNLPPSKIRRDREWILFNTTAAKANEMLQTDLEVYRKGNTRLTRALRYFVPATVRPYIRMIAPIVRFGSITTMKSQIWEKVEPAPVSLQAAFVPEGVLNETACNTSITPDCLRALYKIDNCMAEATPKSLFGITGYLEQYAKYDMLRNFTRLYAPYASKTNFSVVSINGGRNDQNDTRSSAEANLDIQYGLSLSYDTPVTYYSTAGRGPLIPDSEQPNANDSFNEPYLDFLTYMLNLNDDELPQTLSTSYGENEQSVPRAYNEQVCQMFAELGVRGVSVIFASGDSGPGGSCMTNDGTNTSRFQAIFPASCPWVTSVGATYQVNPESAASFSSGGFSDVYGRAYYQNETVNKYLEKLGDKWEGLYNRNGRGFPDVAAQGMNFNIFEKGQNVRVHGTSASAPVFAAIVSLLNNARLQSGKPPLGFLNPWLYSLAGSGFTDIVDGGSRGCTGQDRQGGNTTRAIQFASWNATEGWDPVTGLGTPLFDKLLQISSPDFTSKKICLP